MPKHCRSPQVNPQITTDQLTWHLLLLILTLTLILTVTVTLFLILTLTLTLTLTLINFAISADLW